jgi:SAM-dependent methyltransferase
MSHTCRVCAHPLFASPLVVQHAMPASAQGLPSAHEVADDQGVDLTVRQCAGCGLVQLDTQPVPYWRNVIRAAGISPAMRDFRRTQFSDWIRAHGLTGRKVLEVGCGRGEYLAMLGEAGVEAVGIEHSPASVATCRADGLRVQQMFLNDASQRVPDGPFDGFMILNFLEHIPTPHLTLRGIAANLADCSVGLVEVPNFDQILREDLFAEFVTDHLFYFTRDTLHALLSSNGFEVLDCTTTWGDNLISATVRKRRKIDLGALARRQTNLQAGFDAFLAGFAPGRVAIWGASHQALALISLMRIGPRIRFVVDSAPFKQGRLTPASHLPIVAPARLDDDEVDAIIVLAAMYSNEVVRTIQSRHGDRFVVATLRDNQLQRVPPLPRGLP